MADVEGTDEGHGYGVRGTSRRLNGSGVLGRSDSGFGVEGRSDDSFGVFGQSSRYMGILGYSENNVGVFGNSLRYIGVHGWSNDNVGVKGQSDNGIGVHGKSIHGYAVYGHSDNNYGVRGDSINGTAMFADSNRGIGLLARSINDMGLVAYGATYAAWLDGRVYIRGPLERAGGSFKIDQPLDPANKYLHHSFVESPDMKNMYDGVVVLDDKGEGEIELPDWFGALNKDFRYQLTAIGAPGPNLYIAEEISEATTSNYDSKSSNKNSNSRFRIAGGTSGMKVSWQVTGIRRDPWANANRIEVEENKPAKERGYYLHPDLYGQPAEKGISYLLFPKEQRKKQERLINESQRSNL